MNCRIRFFCLLLFFSVLAASSSFADFGFSDERFQGNFTTENIDRIIEEYELYNGWYWTTPADVPQTFHGIEDGPGWTDTSVNKYNRKFYKKNLFGCRWLADIVSAARPNEYGTYGECFGFASFVGYLLSGEYNPHHKWKYYYSLEKSSGLKVGDILRTEFVVRGKTYKHSAVVYSVSEEEILFIQVSGSTYNRINVGGGYMDGYHNSPKTPDELKKLYNIKICRSPLNETPADSTEKNK